MVICRVKRHEAVTCLKEITDSCTTMSPDSISLIHSDPDDPHSTGYQVHIKTSLDDETKECLQGIVEKHRLALKEEKGKVVIYQPKEMSKASTLS